MTVRHAVTAGLLLAAAVGWNVRPVNSLSHRQHLPAGFGLLAVGVVAVGLFRRHHPHTRDES